MQRGMRLYYKRKKKRQCTKCMRKAAPRKTMCNEHIEKTNQYHKYWKEEIEKAKQQARVLAGQ